MIKLLIAAVVGCILGFGVGYGTASYVAFPRMLSEMGSQMRAIDSERYYATLLSLGALSTLENGDTDKTKLMLARQVAIYKRSFQKYDASLPERQKLALLIQATSEKSDVLRQELAKEPK